MDFDCWCKNIECPFKCCWQTKPFTDKILEQLQKKPKIVLSKESTIPDHNLPISFEISVERNKNSNIYEYRESNKCVTRNVKTIEEELNKMFENVNEETVVGKDLFEKVKLYKHKKSKRNKLVHIFGSTLDDLDVPPPKPRKLIQKNRRHTLSISSLNAGEDILKSLTTQHKRKSESEAIIPKPKIKKIERPQFTASIQHIDFEYNQVSDLLIPPVYKETANLTQESELCRAEVNEATPEISETVKSSKTVPPYIDLTQENHCSIIGPTVQVVVKNEKAQAVSVQHNRPLLSPVSPAEPTQIETEVPPQTLEQNQILIMQQQTKATTTRGTNTVTSFSSRTPNHTSVLKRILQPTTEGQSGVVAHTTEQNVLSHLQNFRKGNHQNHSRQPLNVEILPQTNMSLGKHNPTHGGSLMVHEKQGAQATAQSIVQAAQKQQQQMLRNLGNQAQCQSRYFPQAPTVQYLIKSKPQDPPPYPPQLHKIIRSSREFQVIDNYTCAQMIVNYIHKILEVKMQVSKFNETIKSMFPPDLEKEHYHKLCSYFVEIVNMFGRKLIKDLSHVNVENFDVMTMLNLILTKLSYYNHPLTVYGACFYTHYMLKANTAHCNTPFLKRFFHSVQMVLTTFEKKTEKVSVITQEQKKILESQILEYLRIKAWLEANLVKYSKDPKRDKTKQTKNKQPKVILLQNISLNTNRSFADTRTQPTYPNEEPTEIPVTTQSQNVPVKTPQVQKQTSNEFKVTAKSTDDASESEVSSSVKSITTKSDEEVIDLTWIDDCNDVKILEEIIEFKAFPFKTEINKEEEESSSEPREVVSPSDSGVGSPGAPSDNEGFKCLCGNRAIYVCACNSSMYCSRDCQAKDWIYHQKLCNKIMS